MCYLDAEARLLVVLDDGAHEGAVPLEVLEHHLAEHLAVGARAWAGANHGGVQQPARAAQSFLLVRVSVSALDHIFVPHLHKLGSSNTADTAPSRLPPQGARASPFPSKGLDPMIEAVIIIGACVVLATTKSKQGRSCT